MGAAEDERRTQSCGTGSDDDDVPALSPLRSGARRALSTHVARALPRICPAIRFSPRIRDSRICGLWNVNRAEWGMTASCRRGAHFGRCGMARASAMPPEAG